MKWRRRKSTLKKWIEKHRQQARRGDEQAVLAIFPKKMGYREGSPVYWLEPVRRVRRSLDWDSKTSRYYKWWEYSEDLHGENLWREWRKTRPIHHFAGLVYLTVFWSPAWIFLGAYIYGLIWVTAS